jgi:hypothetical protein
VELADLVTRHLLVETLVLLELAVEQAAMSTPQTRRAPVSQEARGMETTHHIRLLPIVAAIPSETVALLELQLAVQGELQVHLPAVEAAVTRVEPAAQAQQETLSAEVEAVVPKETVKHVVLVELAAMAA